MSGAPESAATEALPSVGFTPGPWELSDATGIGDGGIVEHLVVAGEGPEFGLVAGVMDRNDARLIVSAPALYEADSQIDRLSLVIESAVRTADPARHAEVLAALQAVRAALALSEVSK